METTNRLHLVAQVCQHPIFKQLIGDIDKDELKKWLTLELGRADALDQFAPIQSNEAQLTNSKVHTKACAPDTILHIVSGNTPHGAIQSLLRGLVIGSHNIVKIPSTGLPELQEWVESFPQKLQAKVVVYHELPDSAWHKASVIIATGSDQTIQAIQKRIQHHQTFIPHGHKLSIGIITDDLKQAASLAAKDTSLYDQRGCLSPHAFYLPAELSLKFGELLTKEMQHYTTAHPPAPLTISEAGSVRNLREIARYKAANSDNYQLWESHGSLDWTVIYDHSATLELSCTHRCIYIRPLPENLSLLDETRLGSEAQYLSTVALHPFDYQTASLITESLPAAHRVCPLGEMQEPSLFWHHDGYPPLLSLVKWKDIG